LKQRCEVWNVFPETNKIGLSLPHSKNYIARILPFPEACGTSSLYQNLIFGFDISCGPKQREPAMASGSRRKKAAVLTGCVKPGFQMINQVVSCQSRSVTGNAFKPKIEK
jgi:hypothetical protein